MAIIGVSGSPFVDGNTDRLVKAVLKKSGRETNFVNLSQLRFDPCRGCAQLCAATNMCGIEDEFHPYLKLVLKSEALVLATPYQLGTVTGFMFNFLTRLWCFYHVKKLLADKPVLLISVGIKEKKIQSLKCGAGSYCRVGGLWKYILDKDEKKLKEFEFTPDKFKKWEDCSQIVEEVDRYGKILAEL